MTDNISTALKRIEADKKEKIEKANKIAQRPIDITRYRNERNFMSYPIFSVVYPKGKKDKRATEVYEYNDGERKFVVTPNSSFGMPDQVDGNILRYAISKAIEVKRKYGIVPSCIEVSRYELCRELGLKTGGTQYSEICNRLNRIAGAQFVGNVFKKDEIFTGTLVSFSYPNGSGKIQISFNSKLFEVIEDDSSCLAISDEVLRLKSPLQIRLIEFLRLRMGDKDEWVISLEKLKVYCGVPRDMTLRIFKRNLLRQNLPYLLEFSKDRKLVNQKVIFKKANDPLRTIPAG